jgi:hypothetical protein
VSTPKLRVFVSSVMDGFEDRREAARTAIEGVGAEPVMAEDFPAGSISPRNACLDGIASSDACVFIIGARGGWRAPSGKLVVEEEYEEAIRRNLLISVFIEETNRDSAADGLVSRLSDYVSGHFRATYRTADDLTPVVHTHLKAMLKPLRLPLTDLNEIVERVSRPYELQYRTTARLVVAPERHEEVIDRVTIDQEAFIDNVLAIGHAPPGKIFDFRAAKEHTLLGDALVITESADRRRDSVTTRLEITPEGLISIDKIVSPDDPSHAFDMASTFFLVRGDVERSLTTMLSFVGRFFDSVDRFQRHQRFICGVSFEGVGHRSLVDKLEARSSYSMASDVQGAVVLESPRVIARATTFSAPAAEATRALTLLQRRIKAS